MSFIGWHTVRVPGGLTPEVLKAADAVILDFLKQHGATHAYLVQESADTYRVIDLWPDRATHSMFVEAGRAWEEANGGRYYKAFGGEYVDGQGGIGEVVASR